MLVIAMGPALAGCGGATDYDAKPVLDDLVHIVILPTLSDSAQRTASLDAAAEALAGDPTLDSLSAAQEAWRSARVPWRNADSFSFGPVETDNLGSAIDWWPAKPEIIEEKIAAGTTIDSAYIDTVGTSAKGFMALEYMLFDSSSTNDAILLSLGGDPAASRRAYLAALGENLAQNAEALRAAWAEDGGNYAEELLLAGAGSATFPSGKTAIDELVNQMVFQADKLLNERIGKPAGKSNGGVPLPEAEESSRSDASIADMLASLDGIQAVYDGKRGENDGMGISDLVRARNVGVDDRTHAAFTDLQKKIGAIPAPFRTAIFDNVPEVDAAYESARGLKRTLATEVVSVLGTTLRFNDADGD